jgi:putative membrane protein
MMVSGKMTTSNQAVADTDRSRTARATSSVVHGLQGVLMGTADVIPGVSGGTVALILGIYERLIDTIHEVAACALSVARRDGSAAAQHWRRADFGLVVPLGLGIVIALGIGSLVLPPLIEDHPVIMSSVFFGLIAGALPIPWRRIGDRLGSHTALAVAGGVVAFVFAGLAPATVEDPALLLVFGAAAIAVCAMILPGVSGAYLLLIMGMYEPTLHAAADLDVVYIGVFVLGAATGLGAFSQVLAWLLDTHHDATMAVLVGLMAGSLRRLWPWQTDVGGLLAPDDGRQVVLALACAAVGLALVTALTLVGDHRDGSSANDPAA